MNEDNIGRLKTSDFEPNGRGIAATIKMASRFNMMLETIVRDIQSGLDEGRLTDTPAARKALKELKVINAKGFKIEHTLRGTTDTFQLSIVERFKYYYTSFRTIIKLLISTILVGVSIKVASVTYSYDFKVISMIILTYALVAAVVAIYKVIRQWADAKNEFLVARYRNTKTYSKSIQKVVVKVNKILEGFEKVEDADQAVNVVNKNLGKLAA